MDTRTTERPSQKRYRSTENITYLTISLTLDKKIISFLDKEVQKTKSNNASKFIEENIFEFPFSKMPTRRKFQTFPIKKTFTFTEKFVKRIKKTGNMSLAIEQALLVTFNIQ